MSHEAVYRTAPATLGLLKNLIRDGVIFFNVWILVILDFFVKCPSQSRKMFRLCPPPFSLENVQTHVEKLLKKYGLGSPPTLTPSPSPENCPNMTLNCLNLEVTPPLGQNPKRNKFSSLMSHRPVPQSALNPGELFTTVGTVASITIFFVNCFVNDVFGVKSCPKFGL